MPKLSELVADAADLPILFGSTTLTVRYRPSVWTIERRDRFITEGVGLDVVEFLAAAIIDWDLEDEQGSPVALEPEAIRAGVTPEVARSIFHALIAALDEPLGKALGIDSPARSSTARTRSSAKSRSGTR